jgi:tRNA1Val (adenine37-N6)-methyltransferase
LVREARRPAGWVAPGPAPAGPGERADLWPAEGEDLCHLTGDWRIFQRLDGHRWSLDDLLTAWYAVESLDGREPARALDLGCGIGSVLMMIAWRFPAARCEGVEAQAQSVALARRSLAYNGADGRVAVRHCDLRDTNAVSEAGAFDLVTGTPPYIPLGKGVVSDKPQRGPCRFELRGGVEGYLEAGARALAPDGRLVLCLGAGEQPRVAEGCAELGLRVVRQRDVVPRVGRRVLFTLFALRRRDRGRGDAEGKGEATVVEAPLLVRGDGGRWTPEYERVRAAMGLPPSAEDDVGEDR